MLVKGRSPYSRLAPILATVALLSACASGPTTVEIKPEQNASEAIQLRSTGRVRSGYACCNLRYSGNQLSDANYAQLPFIPLGTPVLIREIDAGQAIVEINGKQLLVRPDKAQTMVTPVQWLEQAVQADDPRPRLDNFPAGVRAAVQSGRVIKGMTREQVIMAIGYPQVSDKKGLEAASWRYLWSGFVPFYIHWTRDKLSRITGHSEIVNQMTYK